MGWTGTAGSDRSTGFDRGARATAAGVTGTPGASAAASGPPMFTRTGGSATDVPPSAATGAAVEPARADLASGGPASGMAGGRGDDLARAQRTGAELAQRSARAAGQFVKQASETEGGRVPATALRESAVPGHGKGRLRQPSRRSRPVGRAARAAGCSHEGWKPVRGETRSAATGLDAKHDSPTPRSGGVPTRDEALTFKP